MTCQTAKNISLLFSFCFVRVSFANKILYILVLGFDILKAAHFLSTPVPGPTCSNDSAKYT